ncbi:MAG: glycosyltransferase family 4 protein [Thermoanaerobaculia bacterium]|nr:glycosyltransferase family 4 protein [Thermoanaerobaculia bacterium]
MALRITYLAPRLELGGGSKVLVQHAHLLAERGHKVTLVGEGPAPDWLSLEVPYHDSSRSWPKLPTQDLVIATFWTTIARALAWGNGPVAHFCQGYEGGLEHLASQLPEIEAAYAQPLPALVVSPHLGEFLEERFGRPSEWAPPVVDPLFVPIARFGPGRRPTVVVPGIYEAAVKNVPTALQAVLKLRKRGLPVRLVRFSALPITAEERATVLPDRYFHHVTPAEVAQELRGADLMIAPSRAAEGFGLPLLEAFASGVPAVASRIPSTLGYAASAATLVDSESSEAFADEAERLLRDRRAWRRARLAGQQIAEHFSAAAVGPQLEQAVVWAAETAAAGVAMVEKKAPRAAKKR